jgi:L-lactate dehydrogenase complex protein LldF
MLPTTDRFKKGAKETLADPVIQMSMEAVYTGFHTKRQSAAAATEAWDDQRDRGRAIKEHTIENLDYYLEMLTDNVDANGGNVFFANDSAEATEYILNLARDRDVKTVIKSKSMVSEEMSLAHEMEAVGIEAVETDLGEYIIQLAGEAPYHIIAPAIHKSQEQVAEMFKETTGVDPGDTPEELTTTARGMLRETFQRADMSVTGVNFAVAESGSIVLVTNEGNGRMCTSIPRVHVAVMGMEKIVPSMQDLGLMLRILIRSATGQRISSYVTMVNGPRRDEEEDGPEEFHLVIVDNGRMKLLADEKLREALYCLRCGACLNACPVYRKVGGHSYGWVYPGPIGAVVSPVLSGLKQASDLPFASSLCGACREVCPVRIDIPNMLLHLRNEVVEGPPEVRSVGLMEEAANWQTVLVDPSHVAGCSSDSHHRCPGGPAVVTCHSRRLRLSGIGLRNVVPRTPRIPGVRVNGYHRTGRISWSRTWRTWKIFGCSGTGRCDTSGNYSG